MLADRDVNRDLEIVGALEKIRSDLMQAGRERIQDWLVKLTEVTPDPMTECHHCGHVAHYVFMRPAILGTQFGMVRYSRAYYVCSQCHRSTCPLDQWINNSVSQRTNMITLLTDVGV